MWSLNEWAGLALILAGGSVLVSCVIGFAKIGRGTLSPLDPVRHLVTRGLYAFTRNPMYMGVIAILLGEALFFWSGTLLVYTLIVTVIFNLFILLHEEPWLRRKFGKEYENYCGKVGRWVTFSLPF